MLKYLLIAVLGLSGLSAAAQYAPENDAALAAARAGDWQTAWDIWKPLADAGDARAQSNIGTMYDKGLLVTADDEEAVRWFRRAAGAGFGPGQFNLANMLFFGNGVARDYDQAFIWYQAAARQGVGRAQMGLVRAYFEGYGTEPDPARAFMWMVIAAKGGYADAVENLPEMEARVGRDVAARGRAMAQDCLKSGLPGCA